MNYTARPIDFTGDDIRTRPVFVRTPSQTIAPTITAPKIVGPTPGPDGAGAIIGSVLQPIINGTWTVDPPNVPPPGPIDGVGHVMPAPFPSGGDVVGTGNAGAIAQSGNSTGTAMGNTGTPAELNTGGAGLAGNGPLIDALINAISGGGSGQSTLDAGNSPSAAALEQLQPTSAGTGSTSNPAVIILLVGALAIGGAWLYFKHKGAARAE